jgi:hypothetical protein
MAILKVTSKTGKVYEYEKKWVMLDMETWSMLGVFASQKDMSMNKAIKELLVKENDGN